MSEGLDLKRDIKDDEIKAAIENEVFERSRRRHLTASEKHNIISAVFNSMRRLDILQPILEDGSVTEIMVNGTKGIFIEKDGRLIKLEACFEDTGRLEDVIQSIVSKVNRMVNQSSPIVDARLKDGSRVNVVLPPISLDGPVITIRKFPDKPIGMKRLIEYGSITYDAAEFLKKMVTAKYNIFISGGTGSGKTTFLNALSSFIPSDERIITIEDSAELQITGIDNIVRMETRNANAEGKGEISIRDLIRTALRMRPERIIVGEVRGAEAIDMLTAMNTGHDGSLSTGHANSTGDMLKRLETMVMSGTMMSSESIRQQISSAIDIVIHLSRLRDRTRRVVEISEVGDCGEGRIVLNPLFVFKEEKKAQGNDISGSLKRTGNKMTRLNKLNMAGMGSEYPEGLI